MQFKMKMMPLAGAIAVVFAGAAYAQEVVKIGEVAPNRLDWLSTGIQRM